MPIRKKIIKEAAKLYAASLVWNSLGTGADSDLFLDGEREYFHDQLIKISERIHITPVGSIDDAIIVSVAVTSIPHS